MAIATTTGILISPITDLNTQASGPSGDGLLLETSGYLLLETGDFLLLET